jgi:hypothetical protein
MALSAELAGVQTAAKVLLYDLETAPLLAHIWSPWDKFVTHDRLIHDSFILTWSAKWLGEKEILFDALTGKEALKQNDKRLVKGLADLINQADIVVAHNGDKFDVPMLNNRLLYHRLSPIPPVRSIDTCQLAKRNFRLAFNKLDYLGEFLGVGKKIDTGGFKLWEAVYHGDEAAMAKMVKYNKQDVVLLERVFDALAPYVRNFPRLINARFAGEEVCPYCGSGHLIRRGYHQTNVSNFQRFECKGCGRYSRRRTSEKPKLALTTL